MDELAKKVAALGVPGLVLVVVIGTTGLVGGAAIVAALAALGGPFGMFGGIGALVIMGLVADAVAKFGLEKVFGAVVNELYRKGTSKSSIKSQINSYWITKDLKLKICDMVDKL